MEMSLILWSGGCDSTLALIRALNDWKRENNSPAHTPEGEKPHVPNEKLRVRTISLVHPNVPAIYEQRNARNAIREALKKQGHEWDHTEVTVYNHSINGKLDSNGEFGAEGAGENGGIVQPLIWIPIAILYLKSDEDLVLGYIKGDDAQYYLTTLRNGFDNLQWVAGRTGKMLTPLDCTSKAEVIHHLKEAKIYKYTWHCEDPIYAVTRSGKKLTLGKGGLERGKDAAEQRRKQYEDGKGKPCGKCHPCITHRTALWQLANKLCPTVNTYIPKSRD